MCFRNKKYCFIICFVFFNLGGRHLTRIQDKRNDSEIEILSVLWFIYLFMQCIITFRAKLFFIFYLSSRLCCFTYHSTLFHSIPPGSIFVLSLMCYILVHHRPRVQQVLYIPPQKTWENGYCCILIQARIQVDII